MARHSKDTKKLNTNATSQSVADSKAQAGLQIHKTNNVKGNLPSRATHG